MPWQKKFWINPRFSGHIPAVFFKFMEYPRYGFIPEEKLGFGFTRYRSIVFNFGLLNVSKSLLRVGI